MTKEEAASGLIAISRWLEIQGLLGEKAKKCFDFAIADLCRDIKD